jgi:hypothetical protein
MDAEPKTKADAMDGGMETGGRNGRGSVKQEVRSVKVRTQVIVPMQGV